MSKFEREIIKEFLEAIIPDKTNRLFIRTKTCPLGIWITGKQIKAKLKDSLDQALHSHNQDLLKKIEEIPVNYYVGNPFAGYEKDGKKKALIRKDKVLKLF